MCFHPWWELKQKSANNNKKKFLFVDARLAKPTFVHTQLRCVLFSPPLVAVSKRLILRRWLHHLKNSTQSQKCYSDSSFPCPCSLPVCIHKAVRVEELLRMALLKISQSTSATAGCVCIKCVTALAVLPFRLNYMLFFTQRNRQQWTTIS